MISLGGRNILVSAAAGSGKTAVLVERIITMLTRTERPVDVDRLLIVTFTEAAATEMKERIRRAVEDRVEKEPENEQIEKAGDPDTQRADHNDTQFLSVGHTGAFSYH